MINRPPSFKKIFRGFHYGYLLLLNRVDLSAIARGNKPATHPFDNAAIADALWVCFLVPFIDLLVLPFIVDASLLNQLFSSLFAFVSILSYLVVSYSLLLRFGRAHHYRLFITSFIWFNIFFRLISQLFIFVAFAINPILVLFALPMGIWRFVVLYRITRTSLGIGGWAAFGLVLVDFILTIFLFIYFSDLFFTPL